MIVILVEVTLQLTINDWLEKFYASLSWISVDVCDIIMSSFFSRKKLLARQKT